jgi:hypothetical protein
LGPGREAARSVGQAVGLKTPANRLAQTPCAGFLLRCYSCPSSAPYPPARRPAVRPNTSGSLSLMIYESGPAYKRKIAIVSFRQKWSASELPASCHGVRGPAQASSRYRTSWTRTVRVVHRGATILGIGVGGVLPPPRWTSPPGQDGDDGGGAEPVSRNGGDLSIGIASSVNNTIGFARRDWALFGLWQCGDSVRQ